MALLLKVVYQSYIYARDDLGDYRTADWFLVHSPMPLVFIVTLYLLTVTELLPNYMEKREPFELRKLLVVYNLIQILLNAYIVTAAFFSLHTLDIRCSLVDYSNDPHALNFANLTWFYFMVKLIDLLDTVFFILRKKFHQVTFLHVYHHFGTLLIGWFGTKYIAGGESIFLGYINSAVHVVMYSYYLFAAWKPEMMETSTRLKKHVTQLQLLQFFTLLCLYVPKLFTDCAFPKPLLMIIVLQNIVMISMFGHFYYKTYSKSTWKKQSEVKDR